MALLSEVIEEKIRKNAQKANSGFMPEHLPARLYDECASCSYSQKHYPSKHAYCTWTGDRKSLRECSYSLADIRAMHFLLWLYEHIAEGEFLGQSPGFLINAEKSLNFSDAHFAQYWCEAVDENDPSIITIRRELFNEDEDFREAIIYTYRAYHEEYGAATNIIGVRGTIQPGDEILFGENTLMKYCARPIILDILEVNDVNKTFKLKLSKQVKGVFDKSDPASGLGVTVSIWREAGDRPRFPEVAYIPVDWPDHACAHCKFDPTGSLAVYEGLAGIGRDKKGRLTYCALRLYHTLTWVRDIEGEDPDRYRVEVDWVSPSKISDFPQENGPCCEKWCDKYQPLGDLKLKQKRDLGMLINDIWWGYDKGIEQPPGITDPRGWKCKRVGHPTIMQLVHTCPSSLGDFCADDIGSAIERDVSGWANYTLGLQDYEKITDDDGNELIKQKPGGFYVHDADFIGNEADIDGNKPPSGWVGDICAKYWDELDQKTGIERWRNYYRLGMRFPPLSHCRVPPINQLMMHGGMRIGVGMSKSPVLREATIWVPLFVADPPFSVSHDLVRVNWASTGHPIVIYIKPLAPDGAEEEVIAEREVLDIFEYTGNSKAFDVILRLDVHFSKYFNEQNQVVVATWRGAPGRGFPLPDYAMPLQQIDWPTYGSPNSGVSLGHSLVPVNNPDYAFPIIAAIPANYPYSGSDWDPNAIKGVVNRCGTYLEWGNRCDLVRIYDPRRISPQMIEGGTQVRFVARRSAFLRPVLSVYAYGTEQQIQIPDFSYGYKPETNTIEINPGTAQVLRSIGRVCLRIDFTSSIW